MLNQRRADLRKTSPYAVAVEFDPDSEWWIVRSGEIQDPPPDLSVLVGSIAYQSLSAFNHLVWELAARKYGRRRIMGVKQHVQIPVAFSRSAFEDNPLVTQAMVSKKALAVIEGLQPYKEGHGAEGPHEHPLPLIKEIADSDKHRVIAGLFTSADLSAVSVQWDASVASNPTYEPLVSEGDVVGNFTPVTRIRFERGNAEANVQVRDQPDVDLLFQTDNWLVRFDDVGRNLKWAYAKFLTFAPLFSAP